VNFDVTSFTAICFWVIPVVLFFTIIIRAIISSLSQRYETGEFLAIFFSYLFCIGVIVHEAAHWFMCTLFNIPVKETVFFHIESNEIEDTKITKIGGYILMGDVNSLIASIGIAIAPLIINGLLVAIIVYYWPLLKTSEFYGLFIFLGIALSIGAKPSKQDLAVLKQPFQLNPARSFLEGMSLVFLGILFYILLVIVQVTFWVTLLIVLSFCSLLIYQARAKVDPTKTRTYPRI